MDLTKEEVNRISTIITKYRQMFNGVVGYLYSAGTHVYTDYTTNKGFDISFLGESEVMDIMQKSIEDGVNYLYKIAQGHEYNFTPAPDCLY